MLPFLCVFGEHVQYFEQKTKISAGFRIIAKKKSGKDCSLPKNK